MKKTITIVLSLIFVFALASLSIAAEKKAASAAAAPAKAEASKQVIGNVSAVDVNAKTLTVKGRKADVTVFIDDKTKIMAGKDTKTLADIKVGDKTSIKYTEADGKNTAKSIAIHTAPASSAKKKEIAPAAEKK